MLTYAAARVMGIPLENAVTVRTELDSHLSGN
jgi:hypothetical protein